MSLRPVVCIMLLTCGMTNGLAGETAVSVAAPADGTPVPVASTSAVTQPPPAAPVPSAPTESTGMSSVVKDRPAATLVPEPPPEPVLLTPKAIRHLVDSGKDQEALQALQDYLTANSQDGDMWFLKSQVLTRLGHADEALQVLRGMVDRFPEMAAPYNNLAVLYAAKGQLEEARKNLTMALMVQPNYATAQENLGDVYVALAKHAYQAALILDPRNKALKAKSEKLD